MTQLMVASYCRPDRQPKAELHELRRRLHDAVFAKSIFNESRYVHRRSRCRVNCVSEIVCQKLCQKLCVRNCVRNCVTHNFKYKRRMSHMCDRHNVSLRCSLDYFASCLKDYWQLLLYLLLSLLCSSVWQMALCTSYCCINEHRKMSQHQKQGGKMLSKLGRM